MFGLFKRNRPTLLPDEPIEMKVSIEIDRPADEVYALLDFADARHQLRARGNEIREISSNPLEYRLWYDLAPDLNFLFRVTEAVPGHSYAYACSIVPPVGRRLGSHEAYTIEPTGEGSCTLTFVNTITHRPGLTEEELGDEVAKSSVAAADALTKLKIQAEFGVEAVEGYERELGQR
ncbi:Polyketide cyclase / dehydrase and lipid transport [Tsuneonella dongtanensis]|uniref:Polyketide cyclase / dehydrase and lipid transport n=1 Tax=Tsuneonella dongtanensis TaxID=692370 RepID=A0A1B2ADH0_9SPHN|nr:hypothetical protein [Tsuneonella dongtanensis]ANY20199.1 Polyketide cyclase / dehydrase and lipid transport [Tsuneonella dongtanensis]